MSDHPSGNAALPASATSNAPLLDPQQRIAGILAPVFTLTRAGDLGVGDTRALLEFVDWAASHGFTIVKFLPVNETGPDNSPYNAVSAVALDPVLLAVSPADLPDLTADDYAAVLAAREASSLPPLKVDYPRVRALKLAVLERAYAHFETMPAGEPRAAEFAAFRAREAEWLEDYALFRALMQLHHGNQLWTQWPQEHSTPAAARSWLAGLDAPARAQFGRDVRFFQYVQWQAFVQWTAVRAHASAKGVALMGDIPIGVSRFSADVWAERHLFLTEWNGGTPPDGIFAHDEFVRKWGQNWGIPLYNWDAMRADDLRWWRRRVRATRTYVDMVRIDHVMGFYRIYGFPWLPERNEEFLPLSMEEAGARMNGLQPHFHPASDDNPDDARRNLESGSQLLARLTAEAGPYRLIGEDLGVVPWYVRGNLESLGMAGYRIPQWEFAGGQMVRGADYARLTLATYGTHDHETLHGVWLDGLSHRWPEDCDARRLCRFAGIDEQVGTQGFTPAVHQALLRALFASNAWIAVLQLADVFAWEDRINLPGTSSDENWSRRLRKPLLEAEGDGMAAQMRELIAASGRAVPPL